MSWYGMEQVVAQWLTKNGLPFVQNGPNPPSPAALEFDFLITGDAPTILEIKYTRFGNVDLVEELFLAGCHAFHRFRLVVILVGNKPSGFDRIKGLVSKLLVFDPALPDGQNIDEAASTLLSGELLPWATIPTLSLDDYDVHMAARSIGHRRADMARRADRAPLKFLFGDDVEKTVEAARQNVAGMLPRNLARPAIHELDQLLTEYRCQHYTAAALRLGRCFESIVYACARHWGIDLFRSDLDLVIKIKAETDALNSKLADLAVSSQQDPEATKHLRDEVEREIRAVQQLWETLRIQLATVDAMTGRQPVIQNVDSVLKQLQRRHKDQAKVNEILRAVLKEKLSRRILDIRNAAAHADPKLEIREVKRDQLCEMLGSLSEVIQRLLNVVDILATR